MTSRTIGITGGGGFIGQALAERLAARGDVVRGLDLVATAQPRYAELGGELVVGDVCDPDAVASFVDGLDDVVHTAAIVRESGEWAEFERVNVDAPRLVAEQARAAGVDSMVHVSSVMVHGFDFPDGVPEDGPLDGAGNPYCDTKVRSEEAVLAVHEPGTFDVFVVRPGDVYGPGSQPWTIRPVELMQAGLWATLTGADQPLHNHVYIDNLVDGLLLVWASGRSGEPFTITDGARTTTADFFGRYAEMLGIELPSVAGEVAVELGTDPEAVRYLLRHATYGIEKVRSLGYEPAVDLDEGMARTEAWLRSTGRI